MYTLSDFDFDLPAELIAQTPLAQRSASRLLEVSESTVDAASDASAQFTDRIFSMLPQCLNPGDLVVFNDTKVLKARFHGYKSSGGKIEVLIERLLDSHTALAQIRASKTPRPGTTLRLANAFDVTVGERATAPAEVSGSTALSSSHPHDTLSPFHILHFPVDCAELIERYGQLPLPPYITHPPTPSDERRYQTVFAAHPGAVAAPTAGLHFDAALLDALDARGVRRATLTLHVGAGTFQPVRAEHLAKHKMHSESYYLPVALANAIAETHARGGQIVAVGTTSLRALEAAAQAARAAGLPRGSVQTGPAETDIFITPGYSFQLVDRLITNFHLPKSTLLMLVCAFAGYDTIQAAYRYAIAQRYRFFSYGDAMLLTRPRLPTALGTR